MKTWKQSVFFGMVAIIALSFSFIGCDNDNGNTHTHEFGTVWESNNAQHWHECSCGEKTDIADHTWGWWIETKAPTTLAEGEETKECSICGKTETKPIAKLVELTGEVTIDGLAEIGQTLTANTSKTNGTDDTKFTYQWKNGSDNVGTDKNTYMVAAADLGGTITVSVTYEGMTGSKTSPATAKVEEVFRTVDGAKVVGIDGVEITQAYLDIIEAAIVHQEGAPNGARIPHMAYIRENLKEFRVIPGGDDTWVGVPEDEDILIAKISILTLNNNSLSDIGGAVYWYVVNNNLLSLQPETRDIRMGKAPVDSKAAAVATGSKKSQGYAQYQLPNLPIVVGKEHHHI
jgi:hypothetical protein